MSGGHFNYYQYQINEIAEEIEYLIAQNETSEYPYTPETIEEFKKGLYFLQRAYVYAQRIDWLVSCDDGEDSFHRRLAEDLKRIDDEDQI